MTSGDVAARGYRREPPNGVEAGLRVGDICGSSPSLPGMWLPGMQVSSLSLGLNLVMRWLNQRTSKISS